MYTSRALFEKIKKGLKLPPPPMKKGGGVGIFVYAWFLHSSPPPIFLNGGHRPPCSEVLCLGIVTFEQGVAWPTGSYSMAVRPIEEHPCALRGKGTQIK